MFGNSPKFLFVLDIHTSSTWWIVPASYVRRLASFISSSRTWLHWLRPSQRCQRVDRAAATVGQQQSATATAAGDVPPLAVERHFFRIVRNKKAQLGDEWKVKHIVFFQKSCCTICFFKSSVSFERLHKKKWYEDLGRKNPEAVCKSSSHSCSGEWKVFWGGRFWGPVIPFDQVFGSLGFLNLQLSQILNGDGRYIYIFTYIYHKHEPNVGKYASPIECLGFRSFKRLAVFCWLCFFSMFFRAAFVDTRCEKLQARHDEEWCPRCRRLGSFLFRGPGCQWLHPGKLTWNTNQGLPSDLF